MKPRLRPTPAAIAALTVVYFAAGKLGLKLAFLNASAIPRVAADGNRAGGPARCSAFARWPAIFVGAFLVNVTTAGGIASSLGIATGNALEALLGAWLVQRFAGGRHAFDRPRNVFKFTLLAALGATMVSASIGVATLALSGLARSADVPSIWLTWWLGDATGAMVVTPAAGPLVYAAAAAAGRAPLARGRRAVRPPARRRRARLRRTRSPSRTRPIRSSSCACRCSSGRPSGSASGKRPWRRWSSPPSRSRERGPAWARSARRRATNRSCSSRPSSASWRSRPRRSRPSSRSAGGSRSSLSLLETAVDSAVEGIFILTPDRGKPRAHVRQRGVSPHHGRRRGGRARRAADEPPVRRRCSGAGREPEAQPLRPPAIPERGAPHSPPGRLRARGRARADADARRLRRARRTGSASSAT